MIVTRRRTLRCPNSFHIILYYIILKQFSETTIFLKNALIIHNAFPVLFFNKQSADSRHVLYYLPSNVCLPQMFLSISAVHFSFPRHVILYLSHYLLFCLSTSTMYKIHFFAILLILFT